MAHVFLIREPARVVASFNKLFDGAAEDELANNIGFTQQLRIFNDVIKETGIAPIVIDSSRFLHDPKKSLLAVCDRLSIRFDEAMLSWPEGLRDSDGVWAPHWYESVSKSTHFGAPPTQLPELTAAEARVAARCENAYQTMLEHAL